MSYEAAKCPSCGGGLQLDSNMESGFCMYCGSKIIVRDAIQKMKVEVSGQISVSGLSSIENDIMRGQQCLAAKDWGNAYRFFSNAVDKQANCFDAWFGCLKAMTSYFSWVDYNWVKLNGIRGIDSTIRNCWLLSNNEQRVKIRKGVEATIANMQQMENEGFTNRYNTMHSILVKGNTQLIAGICIMSVGIILSISTGLSGANPGFSNVGIASIAWWLGLILIIIGAKNKKKLKTCGDLHDRKAIEYCDRMKALLNNI